MDKPSPTRAMADSQPIGSPQTLRVLRKLRCTGFSISLTGNDRAIARIGRRGGAGHPADDASMTAPQKAVRQQLTDARKSALAAPLLRAEQTPPEANTKGIWGLLDSQLVATGV